jgi:hypothetical protein
MSAPVLAVEFVGGPLDGHHQTITAVQEELNTTATFLITRNLFRLLAKRPTGKKHPVTSVAMYQLDLSSDQPRYVFQGACTPVTVQG